MPRPSKHSQSIANLANLVEDRMGRAWPEIAGAAPTGVWFTGSRVWRLLYPDLAEVDHAACASDWDIFTIGEEPALWIVDRLRLRHVPSCRTSDKWGGELGPAAWIADGTRVPAWRPGEAGRTSGSGYGDGYSYRTDRGIVDLWISSLDSALAEIRAYPTASHAHCRAAWSFADGLIVLPNESARRPIAATLPATRGGIQGVAVVGTAEDRQDVVEEVPHRIDTQGCLF